MMKRIRLALQSLLLSTLMVSGAAMAWDARVDWNSHLSQVLKLNCESSEGLCQTLCGDAYVCELPAMSCTNCIGSNTFFSHFFREVGRLFRRSSGRALTQAEGLQLLSAPNLLYLTPESPYNIYTAVSDLRVEQYFNSLCPRSEAPMPVVVVKLDDRARPIEASHVICHTDSGARVYPLAHAAREADLTEVIVEEEESGLPLPTSLAAKDFQLQARSYALASGVKRGEVKLTATPEALAQIEKVEYWVQGLTAKTLITAPTDGFRFRFDNRAGAYRTRVIIYLKSHKTLELDLRINL